METRDICPHGFDFTDGNEDVFCPDCCLRPGEFVCGEAFAEHDIQTDIFRMVYVVEREIHGRYEYQCRFETDSDAKRSAARLRRLNIGRVRVISLI